MVYHLPAHDGGKLKRSGRENERIKEAEEQGGEREGHQTMELDWVHTCTCTLHMMKRLRNIFENCEKPAAMHPGLNRGLRIPLGINW